MQGATQTTHDVDFALLASQIQSLAQPDPHWLPTLSNATALLWDALPQVNWVGFYLMAQSGDLVLGPFQGKLACVRLRLGHGVCGTAAQLDQPQLVPNVHEFAGHIACDAATNSELVIPLHHQGRVIGVLDLDSPQPGRFRDSDLDGLRQVVRPIQDSADFVGLPLLGA